MFEQDVWESERELNDQFHQDYQASVEWNDIYAEEHYQKMLRDEESRLANLQPEPDMAEESGDCPNVGYTDLF